MQIINLTPHALNIHKQDGSILNIEPSGQLARVEQDRVTMKSIDNIEITASIFGEIIELPEPQENTIYVVSGLVLSRTDRKDVFAPGEAIRDEAGRIIGCRGLSASKPDEYTIARHKLSKHASDKTVEKLIKRAQKRFDHYKQKDVNFRDNINLYTIKSWNSEPDKTVSLSLIYNNHHVASIYQPLPEHESDDICLYCGFNHTARNTPRDSWDCIQCGSN